jgi:hemerythrin-like domain-containing protein
MGKTITSYLANDHQRCDALFAHIETHIEKQDWEQAEQAFQTFASALEHHLSMEENVLFPAFEHATGNRNGPTQVMRVEHQHMRNIVERMHRAVCEQSIGDFFDHDDTLRIIMGQHNLKEESILYVLSDQVLHGRQNDLIIEMDNLVLSVS